MTFATDSAGGNPRRYSLPLSDAASSVDPTGTSELRQRFRRAMDARWHRLRNLTSDAIAKSDILGIGGVSINSIQYAPLRGAGRVDAFQGWFAEGTRQAVTDGDGAWTAPYIAQAYAMGARRALKLVGEPMRTGDDRSNMLAALTISELHGVAGTTAQQATRAVAYGLGARQRPEKIARMVADRINSIGRARSRTVVDYMVVKAFNAAILDTLRAAGIVWVHTIPEHLRGAGHLTDAARKTPQQRHSGSGQFRARGQFERKIPQKRHKKSGQFVPFKPKPSGYLIKKAKKEYRQHLALGEDVDVLTAGDDRVCFPAFTLVLTAHGEVPIQWLRKGDLVLTRLGYRKVLSTGARRYREQIVRIITDKVAVCCTGDHPIWCERKDFVPANELRVGDVLQLVGNERTEVRCILDLGFRKPHHAPAFSVQDFIAALILFFDIRKAVPVVAVDFQRDAAKSKVDVVDADRNLPFKGNSHQLKSLADGGFDCRLPSEGSIAASRTEAPFGNIGRRPPDGRAAVLTGDVLRRTPAPFRAIHAVKTAFDVTGFVQEFCSAARTCFFHMSHVPSLALHGAEPIPAGSSSIDGELALASGAHFSDQINTRSFSASSAAKRAILRGRQKLLTALPTGYRPNFSLTDPATAARAEPMLNGFRAPLKGDIALIADKCKRHLSHALCRGLLFLQKMLGIFPVVYDISVEGQPEFYANGVLVHNCDVCDDIAANGPYAIDTAEGLIPAHPNAVLEGSTFVSYGATHEMVAAVFRGPAIHIRTLAKFTTIGPNHPMLTRRGMVKANELHEGDELLYDLRTDLNASASSRGSDLEEVPLVQDAFDALRFSGLHSRVAATADDLHGDAMFCESEVEVIHPTRQLLPVLNSGGVEQLRELHFARTDPDLQAIASFGARDLGGKGIDLSASGGVCCTDAGVIADFYRWVRIEEVHEVEFSGFAFDASTATSLYCSDGFVVSNCRCSFAPASAVEAVADAGPPDEPRDPAGKWTSGGSRAPSVGAAQAEETKAGWRKDAPQTIEALLESAPINQQALAKVGHETENAIPGIKFKDPGAKTEASLRRKAASDGRFPAKITDASRGGFDVQTPEQADEIVARYAQHFDVADEGWQLNATGYFDRKVAIRFENGQVGELQIWPPGMLKAKNKGGHVMYEEWRRSDTSGPRKKELFKNMKSLYDGVREALPPEWKSLFGEIGGKTS